jgi:threonine dehydratase
MIQFSDVEEAYRRLKPVVHHTPLMRSRTFDRLSGNSVLIKAENLQRIGAFKIRGAYHKIASLASDEKRRGIVAHSSGNHAQGVALASSLLGLKATIVMPKGSIPNKVHATREYGAEVVFCDDSSEDRERVARGLQKDHGYVLVPPYDDDHIIAGQGTVMIEIAEDADNLDYLFVPIGGGGLIGGCAAAAKHLFPSITVVGVETEAANDAQQSFRKKSIVRIPPPATIADGMRTQSVGKRNFEIMMKYVDDVVTVTDAQVVAMMRFFLERMKTVVEPTGAVAPAAVFHNVLRLSDRRIATVISGGNVDPLLLGRILTKELAQEASS